MKKVEVYTQEEVLRNISSLENKVDDLKHIIKAKNAEKRELQKQIEYWQDLDQSQIKLF